MFQPPSVAAETVIKIEKHDSPVQNPAIHSGLKYSILLTTLALFTDDVKGKFSFKFSDKPQFNDAFLLSIFCNPSKVLCLLLRMIEYISLNNIKSAYLFVIRGLELK